jgi:DNA modification methylase
MTHPIAFATIERADRIRVDYGNITSLAEDIFVNGLIHPICISLDRQLIAGGRRSRALDHILANYADLCEHLIPHPDISNLAQSGQLLFGIHYTTKTITDLGQLAELELIENVQRHNFSWQEEVQAISRIHQIRVAQNAVNRSTWTQKQTGRLLGCGRSNVSYCLEIGEHLKDPDSLIWKCGGIVEALQYMAKLKHDQVSIALANRVKDLATKLPTPPPTSTPSNLSNFVQTFDPTIFQSSANISSPSDEFSTTPPTNVLSFAESRSILESNQAVVEEAMQVATQVVRNLDCLEFFKLLGPGSVDHVVCDPPYGIEMSNLFQTNQGQQDIERVSRTHDVGQNEAAFKSWLEGCYSILRPKGFCIWFCDQAQWQTLYDHAIAVGFKVQRWPFVWCKTSSCMNQRAEFNFTKSTEIAMVMRKEGGRLVSAQSTNYFLGGNTPEDKAAGVNHPFIKPLALWQTLMKAVALPGATICDPFSGVGSSTRAMLLGGFTPVTCEIDPAHYAQQVRNVAKVYCELKGVSFK